VSVAENTNIPEECACDIFNELISDKNMHVRTAVTKNELYKKLCR
jgi:hypothetical protein